MFFLIQLVLVLLTADAGAQTVPTNVIANAVITTSQNVSAFQCWELSIPLSVSAQPGNIGAAMLDLGDATDMVLSYVPPRFNGGLHNTPTPR